MECCINYSRLNIDLLGAGFGVAYPMVVYNENGDAIGEADNSKEYADLWNGDACNAKFGKILPGTIGSTSFLFIGNNGMCKRPTLTGLPVVIKNAILPQSLSKCTFPLQDGRGNSLVYQSN